MRHWPSIRPRLTVVRTRLAAARQTVTPRRLREVLRRLCRLHRIERVGGAPDAVRHTWREDA